MFRGFLGAVFLAGACCGIAAADDFYAQITKVEDGKVTFLRRLKPKEGEKRAPFSKKEETLPVAADVKVVKAKFNREKRRFDAGEELPGGLNNEWFKGINKKNGLFCQIFTDKDNKKIEEVRIPPPVRPKQP